MEEKMIRFPIERIPIDLEVRDRFAGSGIEKYQQIVMQSRFLDAETLSFIGHESLFGISHLEVSTFILLSVYRIGVKLSEVSPPVALLFTRSLHHL